MPGGWRQSTIAELAEQQQEADERARLSGDENKRVIYTTLYRLGNRQQEPHFIRVLSWPAGTLPSFEPRAWAAGVADASDLTLISDVTAVRFAESVAYVWHLEGNVHGAEVGHPEWDLIRIRRSEVLAPRDGIVVLQFARVNHADEALAALNTFLSSWK